VLRLEPNERVRANILLGRKKALLKIMIINVAYFPKMYRQSGLWNLKENELAILMPGAISKEGLPCPEAARKLTA
jgi:hypothetical protein